MTTHLPFTEKYADWSDEEELDSGTLRLTPPLMVELAETACRELLIPKRSSTTYQKYYDHLISWAKSKQVPEGYLSESVLISYFAQISKEFAPSTLFTRMSAIKKVMKSQRIPLSFEHVEDMLKLMIKNHSPKKSRILPREAFLNYLRQESNDPYVVACKLAGTLGTSGAMRTQELVDLKVKDITVHPEKYIVTTFWSSKSKKTRSFVCHQNPDRQIDPITILSNFMKMRDGISHERLFLGVGPKNKYLSLSPLLKLTSLSL